MPTLGVGAKPGVPQTRPGESRRLRMAHFLLPRSHMPSCTQLPPTWLQTMGYMAGLLAPQSPSLECCVLLQPKHQSLCGGVPPVQVLMGPETQGQLGTQTQKQWPMTPTHTCHPGVQRSPKSAGHGPRLRHLSRHPFLPASLLTPTRIPFAMPPTCHNTSGAMAQCKASLGNPGLCWPRPLSGLTGLPHRNKTHS